MQLLNPMTAGRASGSLLPKRRCGKEGGKNKLTLSLFYRNRPRYGRGLNTRGKAREREKEGSPHHRLNLSLCFSHPAYRKRSWPRRGKGGTGGDHVFNVSSLLPVVRKGDAQRPKRGRKKEEEGKGGERVASASIPPFEPRK